MYRKLNEAQRRRLIWVSDSLIDNNPLLLLRLPAVNGAESMRRLHAQLTGAVTEPIGYLEQVYNLLRDNNLLHLIQNEE